MRREVDYWAALWYNGAMKKPMRPTDDPLAKAARVVISESNSRKESRAMYELRIAVAALSIDAARASRFQALDDARSTDKGEAP